MASSTLPKPGAKNGPCKTDCTHRDCETARLLAVKVCHFCQQPIGYGVRFYDDPDNRLAGDLVHAKCLEEAVETAMA